ncbi:hypothetical protein Tco_0984168 [Tanacetum coccineum]
MSELTEGPLSQHIRAAPSRRKKKSINSIDVDRTIRSISSRGITIASSYPSVGAWSNSAIVRLSAIVSLGGSTRFGSRNSAKLISPFGS